MRVSTSSSALVFAAVLVIGCGDDDAGSCTSSTECESGFCVDGRCSEAPDAGGGGGCSGPSDCDDGNACNGAETCSGSSCRPGAPAPDGMGCDADGDPSTGDFCQGGLCAPSRCGDGIVDEMAMEECDDGNDVAGDGCDDCRFSCTDDAGCDDGDECNGTETCDTASHACASGTPLADDMDCAGGLGRCMAGLCVPRMCMDDAECDDADVCTGMETCTAMACTAGTPPDCDDGIPCTDDGCSGMVVGGCTHRLIDADFDGHAPTSLGMCGDDCDDMDPMVYAGAPDACDGADNDCDMLIDEDDSVVFYADCDGDGYAAAAATSITACTMPSTTLTGCMMGGGWTTRAPADAMTTDCNDDNSTVRPNQTMFQTTAISGAPMESDFDYDCDGMEQASLPSAMGVCQLIAGRFCRPLVVGWIGTVPECGGSGQWLQSCLLGGGGCTPRTFPRTLACR